MKANIKFEQQNHGIQLNEQISEKKGTSFLKYIENVNYTQVQLSPILLKMRIALKTVEGEYTYVL